MKQIIEKEIIVNGMHKYKQIEVCLVKETYNDGSVEYLIRDAHSNQCFGGSIYELGAKGQFYQIAFSMGYWEKVKDMPNSDWQANQRVINEWGKTPVQEIVSL